MISISPFNHFIGYLVRNELHAQLESYEHKLISSTKSVEELKRENAKTVRFDIDG